MLGKFELTGIAPAPRGVPRIKVTFEIDVDGILHVSAEDEGSKNEQKITVNHPDRYSEEELQRIIKEAAELAEHDKAVRERIEARNTLENCIELVVALTVQMFTKCEI